jgi:hypothetical protein
LPTRSTARSPTGAPRRDGTDASDTAIRVQKSNREPADRAEEWRQRAVKTAIARLPPIWTCLRSTGRHAQPARLSIASLLKVTFDITVLLARKGRRG